MNFYKVHAAKYKDRKVLFLPVQFDEIGPDAFKQSSFEIVVLSGRVKIIRNHAFADLRKCKVYIPQTVEEIEPLAFENIDIGNEFYCALGSVGHKACVENELKINENIDEFLELAEAKKNEEDAKLNAEKKARQAEKPSSRPSMTEQRQTPAEDPQLPIFEEKAEAFKPMKESIAEKEEKPSGNEEIDLSQDFSKEDKHDEMEGFDGMAFVKMFGFPPFVDEYSGMGEAWQNQISELSNEEIVKRYDDADFCPEYRYYCYQELMKRYTDGGNHIDVSLEVLENAQDDDDDFEENDIEEKVTEALPENNVQTDIVITEEIIEMLGFPPQITRMGFLAEQWEKQIKMLSTSEILERYDSEDYNNEYKFLCYKELTLRSDLKKVLYGF